jgi:hypothetical protein
LARRYIATGIAMICVLGSLPGIAVACEGAAEEIANDAIGEGIFIKIYGIGSRTPCRDNGRVRLEDRSAAAHNPVRVTREVAIECSFRGGVRGCLNFEFRRPGDRCESSLERALRSPEYEREYEFEGRAEGPFRTAV